MSDAVEIWETPKAREIYMLAGWRQWADAGSISSGLPQYLIQQTGARHIGSIRSDGFYLFQFPGTHDLFAASRMRVTASLSGWPRNSAACDTALSYTDRPGHG